MEKNLITEMKFMMERLENPRMTYTEYEKKHKLLTEDYSTTSGGRKYIINTLADLKKYLNPIKYFPGERGKLSNKIQDLFEKNGNTLTLYFPINSKNNKIIEVGGTLYEVDFEDVERVGGLKIIDQLPSWAIEIDN
jgi:hypothetical protein